MRALRLPMLATTVLAITLAVAVPLARHDSVQAGLTHRFFGFFGTGGFGFPVDELAQLGPATLIAQDADGNELARADVAPANFGVMGSWEIDVPVGGGATEAFFLLADYPVEGAFSFPEGPFPLRAGDETQLDDLAFFLSAGCLLRTVQLLPGFNLVGFTGPDATEIALEASFDNDPFSALFVWDGRSQGYRTWRLTLPESLNQITTLDFGQGLWALMNETLDFAIWRLAVTYGARSQRMFEGWNLVTWTGPNDTDVLEAFSPQAFGVQTIVQSPFVSALTYDNVADRFRTFDLRLPEALNDLHTLNYGDAVWVQLVAPITWLLPAPAVDDPCPAG